MTGYDRKITDRKMDWGRVLLRLGSSSYLSARHVSVILGLFTDLALPDLNLISLDLVQQPLAAEAEETGGVLLVGMATFECGDNHPAFEIGDRIGDRSFRAAGVLRAARNANGLAEIGDFDPAMTNHDRQPLHFVA